MSPYHITNRVYERKRGWVSNRWRKVHRVGVESPNRKRIKQIFISWIALQDIMKAIPELSNRNLVPVMGENNAVNCKDIQRSEKRMV